MGHAMEARAPAIPPHVGEPEPRAAVSWEDPGEPITLTLYGPDGEVSMPLTPTRAIELAKELIEPAVQAIKTDQWGEGWPG